jgi:hypothetical protein
MRKFLRLLWQAGGKTWTSAGVWSEDRRRATGQDRRGVTFISKNQTLRNNLKVIDPERPL